MNPMIHPVFSMGSPILVCVLVTFPLLRHNTRHLQFKEWETYLACITVDSVFGQLCPRQKHHGGRVCWKKAAHFMAANKWREKEEPKKETLSEGTFLVTYLLQPSPNLQRAQVALHSSVGPFHDEYSVLMIQLPSKSPTSEHMWLWKNILELNHSRSKPQQCDKKGQVILLRRILERNQKTWLYIHILPS